MADEEFCEDPRWNVESFPTMYMHKRGKFHLYEGEPEHTDIVRFMKAAAQPSPKVKTSPFLSECLFCGLSISVSLDL